MNQNRNHKNLSLNSFDNKNWLENHLEKVNTFLIDNLSNIISSLKEKQLYFLLQKTGLPYGLPVNFLIDLELEEQKVFTQGSLKALIAETLYLVKFQTNKKTIDQALDFGNYLNIIHKHNCDKIHDFKTVENLLDESSRQKGNWTNQFWISNFNRFSLFIDVIVYVLYRKNNHFDQLKKIRYEILSNVLKIIVSCISFDHELSQKEKKLFKHYLNSSDFNIHTKRKFKKLLKKETLLKKTDFKQEEPWIIKRYYLDVMLMCFLLDENFSRDEQREVLEFADHIGLTKTDVKNALNDLSQFHQNNHIAANSFLDKSNFQLGMSRIGNQLKIEINKNKDRIIQEVVESKELLFLLQESVNRNLTNSEKQKVKNQFLDILKTIPSVGIFLIPGGSFILPILLKIIPKKYLLPSSFMDPDENNS